MMELPYEGPSSFLISSRLLDESGPEWKTALQKFREHCLRYPDGSYEVFYDKLNGSQLDQFNSLYKLLLERTGRRRLSTGRETGCQGFQTNFRGLWGTPRRLYTLWYSDSLQACLGDMSFLVLPDAWSQQTASELTPERLSISIALLRKPTNSDRGRVADMLARWFSSVVRSGVNGEGPVKPTSPSLEWRGRAVFLEADFSQSSQSTLNWLTLWLVNESVEQPIELVSYGDTDAGILETLRGNSVQLTTMVQGNGLNETVFPGESLMGVRIQRNSSFRPDAARIQIELSEPANAQIQKEIEEVTNAWLLIGTYGGFDGHFAYHTKLKWGPGANSVQFEIDMGNANAGAAILALTRVLKCVDQEVARIDRVLIA